MAPPKLYQRNFDLVASSRGDAVTFAGRGRKPFTLEPVEASQLSRVLQLLARPVTRRELLAEVDGDTLDGLVEAGVIVEGTEAELLERRRPPPATRPCRHLVVGVTGAVNAVHVVSMLPLLYHHFCDRLDVVFTESALRFVNPQAMSYFGIGCWTDAFAPRGEVNVPHIHLARSAELVVVMPASAASLQRFASGACSDLLSLVVAATRAPVAVAPSMNQAMWASPAVQRNVQQLRADGFHIIEPGLALEVSDRHQAQPEHGGMGLSAGTVVEALSALLPEVKARPRPAAARGRRSRR